MSDRTFALLVLGGIALIAAPIIVAGLDRARFQRAEKECAIRGYSDYDADRHACYFQQIAVWGLTSHE